LPKNPTEHDIIKSVYKFSKFSYYRLKRIEENGPDEDAKMEENNFNQNVMSSKAKKVIELIVSPPKPPLTISKIHSMLSSRLEESIPKRKIKEYIKDSLNYSF
jgi:hypothetical protein